MRTVIKYSLVLQTNSNLQIYVLKITPEIQGNAIFFASIFAAVQGFKFRKNSCWNYKLLCIWAQAKLLVEHINYYGSYSKNSVHPYKRGCKR